MTQGMTPENFCYWLDGYLRGIEGLGITTKALSTIGEKLTAVLTDKLVVRAGTKWPSQLVDDPDTGPLFGGTLQRREGE